MEAGSYYLAWVIGILPALGCLVWWWNDIWYTLVLKFPKLPPGHLGIPLLGETLTFLWYFKVLRRPDDFINSKRRKYGDGVGLYRTHLFRSPAVVACSPSVNKFIFQSESDFILEWPAVEIVGVNSLVAVHGKAHTRLRAFVSRAINQPDALRNITLMVQPRVVAVLKSWAQKGKNVGSIEAKKVTFQNIGMFFASFEPGKVLDTLDGLFIGMVKGIRAYPINIPGTAYHSALQCRKKAEDIFRNELEKRKGNIYGENEKDDLMGGLIKLKDEEGKHLIDAEVVDNIVSLVLAGYESTSISITWALYYLAKFPNVLHKLREENVPLSKSKNGELISYEDISKLKYTNKVVEETIRMANVAAFVFRIASKDVNYKGYTIPKGWKVLLWIRYLHTNPENFDDPMCFNPDRWNVPAKPGTYQVFGGGSRICAGNMLARLQVAVFLHYLSVGYKWELINPDAEITYLPHPRPVDGVEISFAKLN